MYRQTGPILNAVLQIIRNNSATIKITKYFNQILNVFPIHRCKMLA